MKIYYDSYNRFEHRIVNKWKSTGFSYNSGNVQILRFAWRCKRYWANSKGIKIAKVNRIDINQLELL